MQSHLASRQLDNIVEALANSLLLAANFALFSSRLNTICFIQTYSEHPKEQVDEGLSDFNHASIVWPGCEIDRPYGWYKYVGEGGRGGHRIVRLNLLSHIPHLLFVCTAFD